MSLSNRQIEHRHGTLLALSHALHRKISHLRQAGNLDNANIHEWVEFKLVVQLLIERLGDQQPLLVSAALKGLSLIGSVASLPLSSGRSYDEASGSTYNNPDEKMDVDEEPKEITKSIVAQKVLYLLRSAHSRPKTKEEAAHVLGSLAIGDGAFFTKGNLDAFIKMIKLVCSLKMPIWIIF